TNGDRHPFHRHDGALGGRRISVTNADATLRADFEAAQTGKGSRLLRAHEALALLDYCHARGWFFQSVGAFEVEGETERSNLAHSVLGLTADERRAVSLSDHRDIAEAKIRRALNDPHRIDFQVWIDEVDAAPLGPVNS
ncbi:MAG: hypothetical protein ACI82N_001179, partial [Maricaulis sp.]